MQFKIIRWMQKSSCYCRDGELCACLFKYMLLMFLADEGCGRKRRTEVGPKSEDCMNPDSAVIAAFKGERVGQCVFSAPDEWIWYIYWFLWQCSSKNLTPNMINMSVWWKSVEMSPSRAKGPYSSCTEWPGQIHSRACTDTVYYLYIYIWENSKVNRCAEILYS